MTGVDCAAQARDNTYGARSRPEAKRMSYLQRTIKALVRPGEQSGYVAECVEIPVVTQGDTLDEVTQNLKEAVELHLDGEDLAEMGLAPNPTIVLTMELEPEYA
jgi:predicted RNase H-like HicB family nuclease